MCGSILILFVSLRSQSITRCVLELTASTYPKSNRSEWMVEDY